MGGARGLNYAYDYRRVDGIMVPTTRRVVAFDDNKRKISDPVLVAIDIRAISFKIGVAPLTTASIFDCLSEGFEGRAVDFGNRGSRA